MSVTGTHHVAITVYDLERSAGFYTDLLGLAYDHTTVFNDAQVFRVFGLVGVRVRCVHLLAGRSGRIDLYHFDSGGRNPVAYDFDRIGLQHLAFQVNDLDARAARLESEGVEILGDPSHMPGGSRSIFLRDPDGNIIQLVETPFFSAPLGTILQPIRRFFGRTHRQGNRALVGPSVTKGAEN
ncbi:MAG: VOC family protein [Deltaproteobacteria bacterium]|nr:VOC family protein [Deltaproteobacteria bacterium]